MRTKATIVAYALSVQYFENTTIVAYAGLRVNRLRVEYIHTQTCTHTDVHTETIQK